MKIKNVEFYTSYAKADKIADTVFPEIAFLGRSNVGKSSLLNHLCNKKIAKTSSTPGKTRLINFFLVNKNIYFVDLPGYGYAKVPGKMKRAWSEEMEKYLSTRKQLKGVFLLLDIRRSPNENDRMMNEWLKKLPDIQTFYILTKADKLSKSQANQQKAAIAKELFVNQLDFILYSSTKNIGKKELLARVDRYIL